MTEYGVEPARGGKRWNRDDKQLAAYVRVETFVAMRQALIAQDCEISELVQELIERWLQAQMAPDASTTRTRELIQLAVSAAEQALLAQAGDRSDEQLRLEARFMAEWSQRIASKLEAG